MSIPRLQRTISPIDGSVYVERGYASTNQIDAALTKAVEAQRSWRQVPIAERAEICRRMAAWCVQRADVLAEELTRQMGRPIGHSPFEIRRGFAERTAYMTSIAESALADIAVEPKENFERFVRRAPLGVVLVVARWNYPWLT